MAPPDTNTIQSADAGAATSSAAPSATNRRVRFWLTTQPFRRHSV